VRLDWNARARDLSQVVNLATPTPLPTLAPPPTATAIPTLPPPTPTATPVPAAANPAADAVPPPPVVACTESAFSTIFARLKAALGEAMGAPTACERQDPNGDILHPTTTGLAYRRAMTGTVAFTDGASHWSLGLDDGLLSWPGDAPDPPPVP